MSDLPEFTKSFSCVDLLAYFVPGAMFVLFSYWLLPENIGKIFRGPIDTMFPGNVFALAVYFCVVSYLIGMLLSELSYWLWRLSGYLGKSITKKKQANTASSNRLAVIPHNELIRKEQLFQSFFQLCRCCAVVLPLLLIEASYIGTRGNPLDIWWFFGVVEVGLLTRAQRFNSYKKEYQDELKRREIKICQSCLV